MRLTIDLSESQLRAVSELGREMRMSPDQVVQQAVERYLEETLPKDSDTAFGLWKDRGEDGLEYQDRLRNEWGVRK